MKDRKKVLVWSNFLSEYQFIFVQILKHYFDSFGQLFYLFKQKSKINLEKKHYQYKTDQSSIQNDNILVKITYEII